MQTVADSYEARIQVHKYGDREGVKNKEGVENDEGVESDEDIENDDVTITKEQEDYKVHGIPCQEFKPTGKEFKITIELVQIVLYKKIENEEDIICYFPIVKTNGKNHRQ